MHQRSLRYTLILLAIASAWVLLMLAATNLFAARSETNWGRGGVAAPPAALTPFVLPTVAAETPTPGNGGPPGEAASTTLVLQDDFTACDPIDDDFISVKCENGEEIFHRKENKGTRWIYYRNAYSDTVMQVDARATANVGTRYGLIFRLANDGSSYYIVGLTNDGKAGIFRFGDGQYSSLLPYTSTVAVNPGTGTNHLKVVNQGDQIAVYVNDQWVDTVSDSSLTQGRVAVFVEGEAPEPEVAFDNLQVASINTPLDIPPPRAGSVVPGGGGGELPTFSLGTPTPGVQPTAAPVGTEAATPTNLSVVADLTYDDCDPIEDAEVDIRCEDGELVFVKKSENDSQWVYYRPTYGDAVVEVDTRIVQDTPTLSYGLMVRLDNAGDNAYLFDLTRSGKAGLYRYESPGFTALIADAPTDAITDGTNHLKIVTQGPELSIYVNDQFLGSVNDPGLKEGRVALYVESDEADASVAFDNLRVSKINSGAAAPTTSAKAATPKPTFSAGEGCDLNPGEAGILISNNYIGQEMTFTIGGGSWGTHEYTIPGDGEWYRIRMPPGTYTYTAFIPGAGTDHGERYAYQEGVCRQIRFSP